MKAGDIMTTGAATVRPEASMIDAARLMVEHRISGLPVVDEGDRLVGILTEGDFLGEGDQRQTPLLDLLKDGSDADAGHIRSLRVRDFMTPDPVTIGVESSVQQVVELMTRHRIKRLPVVTDGKVIGIVSRSNLLLGIVRKADRSPRPD